MKKTILFLTDLNNGEDEDLITIKYLKQDFTITVSYFYNIENIEKNFDLIIIRNTWPSNESKLNKYNKLKQDFLKRAKIKKLKIYNDLNASCDRKGKDYLVKLYENSFPVIPSIDLINNFSKLPKVKEYLIKPKNGFSSIGIKVIKKNDIKKIKLNNQIIQPKFNFQYELSFYFVDNELLYCLIFEPSKVPNWPKPKIYNPTKKEVDFAMQFLNWNKMKFGICRVDALRLPNGKLLLLEIEDDSPYFSITEIDKKFQQLFLKKILKSIKKII
jgi:hypothetical protein